MNAEKPPPGRKVCPDDVFDNPPKEGAGNPFRLIVNPTLWDYAGRLAWNVARTEMLPENFQRE